MINSVLVLWTEYGLSKTLDNDGTHYDVKSPTSKLVYLRLSNDDLARAIACNNKFMNNVDDEIDQENLMWLWAQVGEGHVVATSDTPNTEHSAVNADHFIISGRQYFP